MLNNKNKSTRAQEHKSTRELENKRTRELENKRTKNPLKNETTFSSKCLS
jgi:hypothetical protein